MPTTTTTEKALAIDAHYYLAKDFDRAIAFYTDTIGLTIARRGDDYVEFDLANGTTLGLSILPDGRWFAGGGVMFAFADAHAKYDELKAAGVTFLSPALNETPECWTAWALDSEGNNFAVHQRKG